MAIYKMNSDALEEIPATSFGQEGVLERSDLQRLLRDQPEVLEEGLLIISEEFGNWQDSNRRIDLLALDSNGRLVVIELKRGDTGSHMDLQAIRYAAMVANMTYQQVVDTYREYLEKRAKDRGETVEEDAGENLIREHLENSEGAGFASERPRIILASEGFSPELTTCALWLNETGLDVTCVRVQPHRSGSELLIETGQIIPLPEAQNYLVKVREREEEQSRTSVGRQWTFNEGGSLFQQRIASAREDDQGRLYEIYAWASELERQDLAILTTTNPGDKCNLLVGLPTGHSPCLIRIWMEDSVIRFQPEYFTAYAPKSISRMEALIDRRIEGRNHSFGVPIDKVDKEILAALTDAYREANGLLPAAEDMGGG